LNLPQTKIIIYNSFRITINPTPLYDRRIHTINRPIIIHPTRRIRNNITPKTSIIIITQRITARLASNKALQATHSINPARRHVPAQPAADCVRGQDAIVQAHADEFVGGVGRVIVVLGGRVGDTVRGLGQGVTGGAADDFGNEAAAEGGHVGGGEVGVEGAGEGELAGIVVNGVVDGGVGGGDVFILGAGEEFLKVVDALGTAGGIAEGVVVVVWSCVS
jgi:hypothetical protein